MQRLKPSQLPKVRADLIEEQDGLCTLCQKDMRKMQPRNVCVDHCHDEGYVRDVLCRNCNGVLGKVENLAARANTKDGRIKWLKAAIEYLLLHQEPQTPYLHPTHRTPEEKRAKRNAKARARYKRKKEAHD